MKQTSKPSLTTLVFILFSVLGDSQIDYTSLLNRKNNENEIPSFPNLSSQNVSREQITSPPPPFSFDWVEKGPFDIGCRSNSISYAPNPTSPYRMFIATSFGIYRSMDYRYGNWRICGNSDNIAYGAFCSVVRDPSNSEKFYACSGFNTDGWNYCPGDGIYLTTNAGDSWAKIQNTSGFFDGPTKMIMGNDNFLYVAARPNYTSGAGSNMGGIFRIGVNNNFTITRVLSFAMGNDIEVGSNGDLYASNSIYGSEVCGNGKIMTSKYSVNQSNTGNTGTWVDITPTMGNTDFDTIVVTSSCLYWNFIALSESNVNRVYLLSAVKMLNGQSNQVPDGSSVIYRSDDNGVNWSYTGSSPSSSPRGTFYQSTLEVDKYNSDIVYCGQQRSNTSQDNMFRSLNKGVPPWNVIDVGTSIVQTSYIDVTSLSGHADPRSTLPNLFASGQAIFSNDGGVFYSENLLANVGSSSVDFKQVNSGFNSNMYWHIDLHPESGNYSWIGGAQDNGIHFKSAGLNTFIDLHGDGTRCFYDENDPATIVYGFLGSGTYYRRIGTNSPTPYYTSIVFDGSKPDYEKDNPAELDSKSNIFYSGSTLGKYTRIKFNNSNNLQISLPPNYSSYRVSCIKIDPEEDNSIWIGLFNATQVPKLLKVQNANTNSPAFIDKGVSSFPTGSWLNSIYFSGRNNNDNLIIGFANSGVENIWLSPDEGITWGSHDGNLPNTMLQPGANAKLIVNDVLYISSNKSATGYFVLVATSLGLWYTTEMLGSSTIWLRDDKFPYLDVRTIKYRYNDKVLAIGTYGHGVWMSKKLSNNPVEEDFSVSHSEQTVNNFISFYDQSFGATSWSWDFGDGTYNSLQFPPAKSYSSVGLKTITLTINSSLSISKTVNITPNTFVKKKKNKINKAVKNTEKEATVSNPY